MNTIRLGRSALTVSTLPLGAMYFGTRQDRGESFSLLDYYVGRGGTFIDTANIYAHWVGDRWRGGESETVLGEWLGARGNRDSLVIASKVGFEYSEAPRSLDPARIAEECDKSLKRLGLDTIDLYFAHVDDPAVPLEDVLGAFGRLVEAGKVRVIGASNFSTERLAEANRVAAGGGYPRYEVLQQRHTYLRPHPGADTSPQVVLTDDMIAHCQSEDISIMAYSATLGGAYSGRADRPVPPEYEWADKTARLAILNEIAGELNASPVQIVIAWMLHTPGMLPMVAASTIEQLGENLDAGDIALSDEQLRRLNTAGA